MKVGAVVRPRRLGEPDGSLTENGGLLLVAELDRALGVTAALDAGIGAGDLVLQQQIM